MPLSRHDKKRLAEQAEGSLPVEERPKKKAKKAKKKKAKADAPSHEAEPAAEQEAEAPAESPTAIARRAEAGRQEALRREADHRRAMERRVREHAAEKVGGRTAEELSSSAVRALDIRINPFHVLGLMYSTRDTVMQVTVQEAETAYRKCARSLHPDKGGRDLAKFVELDKARQTIRDDALRMAAINYFYPAARPAQKATAAAWPATRAAHAAVSSSSAMPAPMEEPTATGPERPQAMPGLVMLQTSLVSALTQRSRATWTRREDQIVARRTKEELQSLRSEPFRLAAPSAQEEVDATTAALARQRVLDAKINASVSRRLNASLARARARSSGQSIGALKRSARGWTRAAYHRERVREESAAARTARTAAQAAFLATAGDDLKKEWSRYRRESQEWRPPKAPEPRRKKPSKAATMRKRLKRTLKSRLKRKVAQLEKKKPLEDKARSGDEEHGSPADSAFRTPSAERPSAEARRAEAAGSNEATVEVAAEVAPTTEVGAEAAPTEAYEAAPTEAAASATGAATEVEAPTAEVEAPTPRAETPTPTRRGRMTTIGLDW